MYETLSVEHSNTAGAEFSIFRHKTCHHKAMSFQQIIS